MKTAIRKVGNSHGVIIPKPLLAEIGAKANDRKGSSHPSKYDQSGVSFAGPWSKSAGSSADATSIVCIEGADRGGGSLFQ